MQAQLGNIQYRNLKSFTAMSRGRSVALDEIGMIGGKPRVQRTGEALDSISLTFLFHAAFCNPSDELQALYDAMQGSESLPFVFANGTVLGRFAIASVNDRVRKSDQFGNAIYLECDVELKEVAYTDLLDDAEISAIKAGFAYIDSTVPIVPTAIQPNDAAVGAASRSLAIDNAALAQAQLDLAVRSPSSIDSAFAKVKALTASASIAALELANKARLLQGTLNDYERIAQDAEDVARLASDMAKAGNISDALASNAAYQSATAAMKKSAAVLVTIVASRL